MARFCPYCGNQIREKSRFCPICGEVMPERRRAATIVQKAAPEADSSVQPILQDHGSVTAVEPRLAAATHAMIGNREQAGFGLRYGAWMFDFLITLIVMMAFTFLLTAVSRRSVVGSNQDLLIVGGVTLFLVILNFAVLAGSNGQSIGMRILGIQVVRVDGNSFTLKDAVLRHFLGYPLSSLPFFLGFLWMLWDPRQQGWHDKLARTIVVMAR